MMENDNREQLRLRLQRRLEDVMDAGEARAVVLLLFEELCGLSTADVLMGKADELPASAIARMEDAVCRVEAGDREDGVLRNAAGGEPCSADSTA